VERAAARRRAGRGTFADDAHGQAHQCRFPFGSLDPAYQHHDAGAGHGNDGIGTTYAGIVIGRKRAIAGPAPDFDACDAGPSLGGGQKAAGAETSAHGRAGSNLAGSGHASARGVGTARSGARGVKRLMLSKANAER
jgi:hypothetical protein